MTIPIDLLENENGNIYQISSAIIKRVNQINRLFAKSSSFNRKQLIEEDYDDIPEEKELNSDQKIVSRSIKEILSGEIKFKANE